MASPSSPYLMGHTDHERRRLALQAAVLNPLTEGFLARAGLTPGMRVLDLGCGVGDVAIIIARIVGPAGHVTALDIDAGALSIAQGRAAEAGLSQISFEQVNVADHHSPQPYDAVVGRHILIHMADPAAILRQAIAQLHPGGIVAFQEYDLSRFYPNTPPKPLYEELCQLFVAMFTRILMADIGVRLYGVFHDVGLTQVQSRAETMLDGGPDSLFYEWVAETIRSLSPKMEALGIAKVSDLDLDTLAERLKQEALAVGGNLASPTMAGTFGRKPS
jgi:2-polyprenyl-3-methyl-5-hydroxy-6-metoxy-1,4-benzoquinol methylase